MLAEVNFQSGPRAKASLFVLRGQEGLKVDYIVKFSADSVNASLT